MLRIVVFTAVLAVAFAEQVYPCADSPTRECVADYIASVSECSPPTALPTTNTLDIPDISLEDPFFRATDNRYSNVAEGLGNVKNFVLYYDTDIDVTVLSFTFPTVVLVGRAVVDYHQDGKADVSVDTSTKKTYTNIVITVQWQGEQISWGTIKVYATIENVTYDTVNYFQELLAAANADPDGIVGRTFKFAGENPQINLREQEAPTGRQIVGTFFSHYLCTYAV